MRNLPCCHGMRVRLSGLMPSGTNEPRRFFNTRNVSLRQGAVKNIIYGWCRARRPVDCLYDSERIPLPSTDLPRHFPRPVFDEYRPDAVHQAAILFLPCELIEWKPCKCPPTDVDVVSCYKGTKLYCGVALALARASSTVGLRTQLHIYGPSAMPIWAYALLVMSSTGHSVRTRVKICSMHKCSSACRPNITDFTSGLIYL